MEDDFAATTTIGERVAPAPVTRRPRPAGPQGPSFGIPSKLEPFYLLARSARGAGAANLISQVCAAPGVYVFSELLQLPNIKDLVTSEQHASSYQLLEIFAYGTWTDYVDNRANLPELNKAQETKLKQLTILTLAGNHRVMAYSTLLSTLDLASVPILEDLLIDAFYSGVVTGRLDQKEARLEVMSSLGRDVRSVAAPATAPESELMEIDSRASDVNAAPSIDSLTASLTAWLTTITNLLSSLDRHLAKLAADAVNSLNVQEEHEKAVQSMITEVESSKSATEKDKDKAPHQREHSGGGGGSGWRESVGRFVGGAIGGGSGSGAGGGGLGTKEEMDDDEKDNASQDSSRAPLSPSSGARQRKRGRT